MRQRSRDFTQVRVRQCAPGRIRTCDPLLRRQPLCPLSYERSSRLSLEGLAFGWAFSTKSDKAPNSRDQENDPEHP